MPLPCRLMLLCSGFAVLLWSLWFSKIAGVLCFPPKAAANQPAAEELYYPLGEGNTQLGATDNKGEVTCQGHLISVADRGKESGLPDAQLCALTTRQCFLPYCAPTPPPTVALPIYLSPQPPCCYSCPGSPTADASQAQTLQHLLQLQS